MTEIQRSKGRRYEQIKEKYLNEGFPKEMLEISVMKQNIAKSLVSEFSSSGLRRKIFLHRHKDLYGLEYDDFAQYLSKRDGFDKTIEDYLSQEDRFQKRKLVRNITSIPLSMEEIAKLENLFTNTHDRDKKIALLQLFKEETSLVSKDFLWEYLVNNSDDSVRDEILEVLKFRGQLDIDKINLLIKQAKENKDKALEQDYFEFLGEEHDNLNHEATLELVEYLKDANPDRAKMIAKAISRRLPKSSVKPLLNILTDPNYALCHYDVAYVLGHNVDSSFVELSDIEAVLQSSNTDAIAGFIDGIPESLIVYSEDKKQAVLMEFLRKVADSDRLEIKEKAQQKQEKIVARKKMWKDMSHDDAITIISSFLRYAESEYFVIPDDQKEEFKEIFHNYEIMLNDHEKKNPNDPRLPEIKAGYNKVKEKLSKKIGD